MFFPRCLMLRSIANALIYLPSCRLTTNTPLPRNPREPRENDTVVVFLLSPRGRELFNFGNHYAGPQGHTHRICLIFGPRMVYCYWPKFFLGYFTSFRCQILISCCGCSYFPLREELFVINFMPFTQGLLNSFWLSQKTIPWGCARVDPQGSIWYRYVHYSWI